MALVIRRDRPAGKVARYFALFAAAYTVAYHKQGVAGSSRTGRREKIILSIGPLTQSMDRNGLIYLDFHKVVRKVLFWQNQYWPRFQ